MSKVKRKIIFRKRASVFLAVLMVFETIWPSVSLALTSGPSAPEFSSFEPVATTNMVNEFSGDFTYNIPVLNIPGPDGGGYAMSLSYHSGESMESEASWVGYGWTLNPGAINRNKRGFADDTKSDHTFYNDVPKNWTASVGTSVGDPELFSVDIPVSLSAGLRYNNYKGFGYTAGIGLSVKGIVSLGYSVSDGSGSFSAQVNPGAALHAIKNKKNTQDKKNALKKATTRAEKADIKAKYKANEKRAGGEKIAGAIGSALSSYGMHTFGDLQMPTSMTQYNGKSFNISLNVDLDPGPVPIGLTMGLSGNYTQQKNEASSVKKGYGYLYSGDAYNDAAGMMDYYTEKDSPFNKRDRYMGIPFSNADSYNVTGEGLSGGFRLHSKHVGTFRPNAVESKTWIQQVSPEFNLGLTIGAGLDMGVGLQTLKVVGDQWGNGNSVDAFTQYNFSAGSDEPYFFRFSNDLGGDVNYGSDGLVTATVVDKNPVLQDLQTAGLNHQENQMTSTLDHSGLSVDRSGRSSYIGYNTHNDLSKVSSTGKQIYAYDKSSSTNINRSNNVNRIGEQIGEIATVNEDGNTYVYGMPVYSKNEKNLSYSMEDAAVINYNQAMKNISGSNKMKVGTQCADAYATSYLLTQITTPDYVDRALDGPTIDDFGGYTKFEYSRNQTDYHWRMPYQGFHYSPGDLSNTADDMGSFSSGDKEVYYLDKIITKTHIAVFRTSLRNDGKDAADDAAAANSTTSTGSKPMLKLDSICLYTNNNGALGKLVKKTCFSYAYELCVGVPNAPIGSGKLTLKSVWFEYEGIVNAKISPYRFFYEYADPAGYPFPYYNAANPNRFTEYDAIIATGDENPSYNAANIDAWGNYQKDGWVRYNSLQHHLNQNPVADFDPAAWQLKRISLPSGGEIHVQYEQDDYQYVQNRRAMALVSLTTGSNDGAASVFELNTDDLGPYTVAEKQQLADLINSELNNDKIYFKFLYSLIGNNLPALGQCNTEYISGYANTNGSTFAGLNAANNVTIAIGGSGNYALPIDICKDMVKKEKSGKINQSGNCDPSNGIDDNGTAKDVVKQLLNKMGTVFTPSNLCMKIEPTSSYFKIPILKAKKGGGLRVKRLLMYDPDGTDDGMPALYGTEYIYKTENGESSGIATNEPATIREENALVTFLPKRSDQKFLQKAISGIDREQFEGPLGESILPAPSVGYSRIVAKNIHDGKTNTGFIVSEFYTAKDFPFDMEYAGGGLGFSGKGVSNTDMNDQTFDKYWLNVPAVFVNISINNMWASQGYRFVKNNMHGQPKSVSTYAGNYTQGSLALLSRSSFTEYEYFKPGEKISVLRDDGTTMQKDIGKEMEVVMETRGIEDVTEDISTEFDMSVGLIPPVLYPPYFSGSGTLSYAERKMYTHVTSKIIDFPAIQKRVTSMQDGMVHKTDNLVFSQYTGKPVYTVASDGYDAKNLEQSSMHVGKYTQYDIPAYTKYRELGQRAINQRFRISASPTDLGIALQNPSTGTYSLDVSPGSSNNSTGVCNALAALTVGDLIGVNRGTVISPSVFYFHVDGISGTSVSILPAINYNSSTAASAGTVSEVEIISSGRTNQLNANVGSYTTYGATTSTLIGAPNLSSKLIFMANLNAALNNFGSQAQDTDVEVTQPESGLLGDNGCMTGSSYKVKIHKTGGQFYVQVIGGSYNCKSPYYTYSPGSYFLYDQLTGKVLLVPGNATCTRIEVPCLVFCDTSIPLITFTNVVAASASTMNHVWPYTNALFDAEQLHLTKNPYETGAKGKWRVLSSYVYNENTQGGAKETGSVHERNYKNAGTFTMALFNWKNPEFNDSTKWVRTSTVSKYSPNGNVLEEKDALHLYSTAKYGYSQLVPYLIAQNATYGSAYFESFESSYTYGGNSYLEDKVKYTAGQVTNAYAHSGKKSLLLGATTFTIGATSLSSQMKNNGVSFKIWVKDPQRVASPVTGSIAGNITIPVNFVKVAQTGEWTLYEAKVKTADWQTMALNGAINILLKNNIVSQPAVYVDDYIMQPLNAKVNAYVYDTRTLKLLTSFDDQHFGLYYQYNQEGKLVRKIVETERGMKTITETQYNYPKVSR